CKSGYAYYAYSEKKQYEPSEKLVVVDSDILPLERTDEKGEERDYQLCQNCGRLSEYEGLR
uniref:hypothetical protein n=1 Tax=Acetatifactor sp. TaxID=1872090 RepID=UPI004056A875